MRNWFSGALVCALVASACSSQSDNSGSGGAGGSAANGGTSVSAGGMNVANGGAALGSGGANGGASAGGTNAAGDASSGGKASGGGAAGGASGGAASSGGNASGGGAAGAASSGGKASGGSAAGGAKAAGGASSGSGGKAAGGSAGASGSGGAAPVSCTSSTAGYKLVWNDEFEGPAGSAIDKAKWTHDVGGDGWGNSELEYYTDGTNNAALDGSGNLVITAKQEAMGGRNYTSARIKTQGLYSFTYGRVEARMKIPSGQGMWPAFWMLGNDIGTNSWPACGEIDVMENIGKEPDIIHATIHGPGYSAGAGPTKQYSLGEPVASAFHVFAIEWEQNTIRWYVDGTLYSTKTNADIPSGATWVYAHPFFIILNVAVGGGWPGNPDSTTTFPQRMLVDYVRVCQK